MYHYIYDKTAEPLFTIESGQPVAFDTEDAWSGLFRENGLVSKEKLDETFRLMLPGTGPIVVKDAQPGDWLAIKIDKIQCAPYCSSAIGDRICMLQSRFGPCKVRMAEIKDGFVHMGNGIKIPLRPMIGTIGTTLDNEVPRMRYEGIYGGNLDCPTISEGNTLYLPVFIEGAYLYAGDVHAIQGDGELLNPFEVPAHIEMTINVVKGKSSRGKWPRIITDTTIETIGVGNTFELAIEIALNQMIDWLIEDYGFSEEDAALFCGSVVDGRPCSIVNTRSSGRCVIRKEYLALRY